MSNTSYPKMTVVKQSAKSCWLIPALTSHSYTFGVMHYSTFLRLLLPLVTIVIVCTGCRHKSVCQNAIDQVATTTLLVADSLRQRGIHVFGRVDSSDLSAIADLNIEWVTLVAWADQDDIDSPMVRYGRKDSIHMARQDSSWLSRIGLLRSAGFKVFVKPHVWISNTEEGKWRSHIFPKSQADWQSWSESYRSFILWYAEVAESAGVEMFCIGTEFSRLALEKPEFWVSLIADVRAVYSGELTYAANWYEEYEHIRFWHLLDHIGVQAYFPLSQESYPTVQAVRHGWNSHLSKLEQLSRNVGKPVLFTELGYKSSSIAAAEPWQWAESLSHTDTIHSSQTQVGCYQAFFSEVWPQPWLSGVHLWQWNTGYNRWVHGDPDFFIQGKPAEAMVRTGFSQSH